MIPKLKTIKVLITPDRKDNFQYIDVDAYVIDDEYGVFGLYQDPDNDELVGLVFGDDGFWRLVGTFNKYWIGGMSNIFKFKMIEDQIKQLPTNGRICTNCTEKNNCPMPECLKTHFNFVKKYGTFYYGYKNPAAWDEFNIDPCEVENDAVLWCPMFYEGSDES